jgi:hypothetical protein
MEWIISQNYTLTTRTTIDLQKNMKSYAEFRYNTQYIPVAEEGATSLE